MDSRFRGSDVIFDFLRSHQYWLSKKYPLVIGTVMASELAVSGFSFEEYPFAQGSIEETGLRVNHENVSTWHISRLAGSMASKF